MRGRSRQISAFVLLVAACAREPVPDRARGPEAALDAARYALHQRDLAGYFDALTDRAVRATLSNSIGICLKSTNPAVMAPLPFGNEPSLGCEAILRKYGWPEGSFSLTSDAWTKRVNEIAKPREMVVELESHHRSMGAGSSFVWEYLDDVTLSEVKVQGSVATAIAHWHSDPMAVAFEHDQTGWRFTPHPEPTGPTDSDEE